MSDRRRVNGPLGCTTPPVFVSSETLANPFPPRTQNRTRKPTELRKIFLKTGLTPSASGSAYLELEHSTVPGNGIKSLNEPKTGVKLSCTVHGPRPLPRSAPFTPHILLSTHIKYASFATSQRRGYIRDASERDLAVHLENALRGVIIGERWPKSGLDIIINVLEGEQDSAWHREEASVGEGKSRSGGWGAMSILSCCITIASAALADAGIDCTDFVSGGMAAVVRQPSINIPKHQQSSTLKTDLNTKTELVLDPCPSEDQELVAACVVGYLQSRDEITEIWSKGDQLNTVVGQSPDMNSIELLLDRAIEAAMAMRLVLADAIYESTELKLQVSNKHMH